MDAAAVFRLDPIRLRQRPFEHVIVDDFIAPEIYRELVRTFPACPRNGGPTGYSYFWGDPLYDALIADNAAWRAVFEAAQSQAFVDYCLRTFASVFGKTGCTIDISKAAYVSYLETREDKQRPQIANPMHAPHELFVRADILQRYLHYTRPRHLDFRRRVVSMLDYLCDADENAMQGGDLVLHRRPGGWWPRRDVVVRPCHNLMAAFACHPYSHHSVSPVTAQSAPRNFLQILVSSSVDAWPKPPKY
jgi:hypothetical protein